MKYYTNLYMLELSITKKQALSCTKPGVDATNDIHILRQDPSIKRQLKKLDPDKVWMELREWGAWDFTELADDNENLSRLLWLACVDIAENIKR